MDLESSSTDSEQVTEQIVQIKKKSSVVHTKKNLKLLNFLCVN
jgi:hypothetical protein